MIELSDVITNLRTELETARLAGVGEGLRFELGPVELEVSVALAKEAGADAKVKFWVVELGGSGKAGSTATQRIKLTLQPRLTVDEAAKEPQMASASPYVSGGTVDDER